MNRTLEINIESMKDIADELQKQDYIKSAYIDDWGRFNNFSLVVIPSIRERTSTNKLKAIVRRAIKKTNAHVRDCFPPEFTGLDMFGNRMYHSNTWNFDIDYHTYSAESNVFITDDNEILMD
jgi:hypothetical protein